MRIKVAQDVPPKDVDMDGASDVKIRLLVHRDDGATNFYMRQFDVAPGGHTPQHAHLWEHECYILEGQGVIVTDTGEQPVKAGDCVFVEPNDVHQFKNTGDEPLKFLCMVPGSAGG